MSQWYVYIVRCSDETLYTGITTDPARRLSQHNGLTAGGARYTRGRRPVELVHLETVFDRSDASRREREIKRMRPREKKTFLILADAAGKTFDEVRSAGHKAP